MKIIIVIVSFLITNLSMATSYSRSGLVEDILIRKTLDSYLIAYVKGFNTAGECKKYMGLVTLSVSKDEQSDAMLSILLASHMSGLPVKVTVDDTMLDADGICIINSLRLKPEF